MFIELWRHKVSSHRNGNKCLWAFFFFLSFSYLLFISHCYQLLVQMGKAPANLTPSISLQAQKTLHIVFLYCCLPKSLSGAPLFDFHTQICRSLPTSGFKRDREHPAASKRSVEGLQEVLKGLKALQLLK